MDLMPFDELNRFKETVSIHFDESGRVRSREDAEDIIDELFELFLLSYAHGAEATNLDLGTEIEPERDRAIASVNERIAGKTWEERIWEWFDNGGTESDFIRIAETESHRDANTGAFDTAVRAGARTKRWHCMMLDDSRDTHIYLDGVSAPIDGWFYTFTGSATQFPGQFGLPEEDCNCLCWLTYEM